MGDWQPIETAPKDGTAVLVWDAYEGALTVGWQVAKYLAKDGHSVGRMTTDLYNSGLMGWVRAAPDLAGFYFKLMNPTHWMPLPDSPPYGDESND
jgi:hypothetical protein